MNKMSPSQYPTVQVKTPMPPQAATTLLHRGQEAKLPAKFDHAIATYLLSLLDYQVASELCNGENFEPIRMIIPGSAHRAVGLVSAVDYHQTDIGKYREWILALWVVPKGEPMPDLNWVNPLSLTFYAVLGVNPGFTSFAPKMILTEPLPTEIGVDHYGIPKELGQVLYDRTPARTCFEVQDGTGQWIMRTEMPTTRGFLARGRSLMSLIKAFGLGACLRSARRTEMLMTVAGSTKLRAKQALLVAKVDPQTELLLWDQRDCQLSLNPETQCGNLLRRLDFSPALICHVPHLAFVFSGPFDPTAKAVSSADSGVRG
jgi:hypothetical protein